MTHFATKSEFSERHKIDVRCPECHSPAMEAYEQRDRFLLFHLIPLFYLKNTFAKCGQCGRRFRSRVPLARLIKLTGDEVARAIGPYIGGAGMAMVVLSLLLWWIPAVGIGVGITAYLLARFGGRFWRLLAIIGMMLGIAVSFTFALVIMEARWPGILERMFSRVPTK